MTTGWNGGEVRGFGKCASTGHVSFVNMETGQREVHLVENASDARAAASGRRDRDHGSHSATSSSATAAPASHQLGVQTTQGAADVVIPSTTVSLYGGVNLSVLHTAAVALTASIQQMATSIQAAKEAERRENLSFAVAEMLVAQHTEDAIICSSMAPDEIDCSRLAACAKHNIDTLSQCATASDRSGCVTSKLMNCGALSIRPSLRDI